MIEINKIDNKKIEKLKTIKTDSEKNYALNFWPVVYASTKHAKTTKHAETRTLKRLLTRTTKSARKLTLTVLLLIWTIQSQEIDHFLFDFKKLIFIAQFGFLSFFSVFYAFLY